MSYDYMFADRAEHQQLGRVVIVIVSLLVAVFFMGRCSAKYTIEVKSKQEAAK